MMIISALYLGLILNQCSAQYWDPDDPFKGNTLDEIASKLDYQYSYFPDTSHLLVQLLKREQDLRKDLESKLEVYVQEAEIELEYEELLKERITEIEEFLRRRKLGRAIAFSARLTKNLEEIGRARTVVFGSVVTNYGGEYNPKTGKFHCPVDGVYQFFVSILSREEERVKTELVVNGRRQLLLYSAGDEKHRGSLGTNSVILNLEEDDYVWVRMYHGFGDYIHCCWSTFNGALIKTM